MSTIKTAMILAAGRGSRLAPLTDLQPKPTIRVAGRSLLYRTLDHFLAAGISKIVINSHYLPEVLEAHIAHYPGIEHVDLTVLREPILLDTAGGVRNALEHLGDGPFVVANSDIIWLPKVGESLLAPMAEAFDRSTMQAMMLLCPIDQAVGHTRGDFDRDQDGTVIKPAADQQGAFAYTGLQLVMPEFLADLPAGPVSFRFLWQRAECPQTRRLAKISSVVFGGHWLHCGDPLALADAERFFAQRTAQPTPSPVL